MVLGSLPDAGVVALLTGVKCIQLLLSFGVVVPTHNVLLVHCLHRVMKVLCCGDRLYLVSHSGLFCYCYFSQFLLLRFLKLIILSKLVVRLSLIFFTLLLLFLINFITYFHGDESKI